MLLKTAINVVEIVATLGAAMVLGDYLGYKFGRWRLASTVLIVFLVVVVAFAILAGITLAG